MFSCVLPLDGRLGLFRKILSNAPHDAAWIEECEVAHAPRSVFGLTDRNPELIGDSLLPQVLPPVVDVLDRQVHLKICRVR